MRYQIDAAAALTRLAEHARYLRGSETRLLVHLTNLAVQAGSLEVTASEKQLEACLHIGRAQLWRGKRRLAELGLLMHEPTERRGAGVWYLGYLRELLGASVSEATRLRFGGTDTSVSEAPASVSEAQVPPFQRQDTSVSEAPASVSEAPAAPGHSHDQDGPTRARRIESAVVSIGDFSSIDRVLSTKDYEPEANMGADLMARYLRSWAARDGVPDLVERPLDRQILAQCMAIGPMGVLENAWLSISARFRGYKVAGWGFFVTALLAEVSGFTPTQVKERRAALRNGQASAKPLDSTRTSNLLLSKLVHGVRNLR